MYRQALSRNPNFETAQLEAVAENPLENPVSAGSVALFSLLGIAVGAAGMYFYEKYTSNPMLAVLTDPAMIAQAKLNLAIVGPTPPNGAAPGSYPTTAMTTYTFAADSASFSGANPLPAAITPVFTAGLAQFQAALNSFMTQNPAKLAAAPAALGFSLPPFPMRSDGVLDQATFDWLIIAQS